GRTGRTAVPGDQRQRLGDEIEVRQPLRHPPFPARWAGHRDRRSRWRTSSPRCGNRCGSRGSLRSPPRPASAGLRGGESAELRHSLPDGLNRATDVLIGGKIAVVVGYGDVGKGAAEALRGQGARVIVTEIDPICALQATMDGYQVDHLAEVAPQADIVITTTGNTRVVGVEVLQTLKPGAIIGNVG